MLRTRLLAGSGTGLLLSTVFATLMTFVNVGETLFASTRVLPSRPAPLTLRLPPVAIREPEVPGGALVLRTVHPVIARGETVSDPSLATLVATYERGRRPPRFGGLVGIFGLYFLVSLLMTNYLRSFVPSRGQLLRTQAGVLGLIAISLVVSKFVFIFTSLPAYVIPSAAVPLWIALYIDRRSALLLAMAVSFLSVSFLGFSVTALTVYMACGMAAAFGFRDRKHSTSLLFAGVLSALVSALVLVVAKTLFEGEFDLRKDLLDWSRSEFIAAAMGGLASGVIAFFFKQLAVSVLGVVSRERLLDLTDLEQPLLQKMAREAPGSWEHSRAMANLAEAAAAAIGADALLTRVGAYYHDLGKTVQPKYFVENLEHGEVSPHQELEPDVSADAIMAHVVEGVNILRRGGIPESVIEFSYTHHGTSVIEYFWHKCLERGNPKGLKEGFFRYPGMRPRSRETAILMLIDSIEAASRTVFPPERAKFEEMVQRIIFVKLKQGQLDESGLTLEDLRVLVTRIADTLTNVYHGRVKYPWQERRAKGQEDLPIPGVMTEKEAQEAHSQHSHAPPSQPRPSSKRPSLPAPAPVQKDEK